MSGLDLGVTHRLLYALGRLMGSLVLMLATAAQYLLIRRRPSTALAAGNLFLCKQVALYQEREIKPRRADEATRIALVWLSKMFDWDDALAIVKTL